jgi:xanthine dehydrogenase small subunit
VTEARLAYGGMAATPTRAKSAEQALVGQPWTHDTVEAAIACLATEFTPFSDHRGTAWYRNAVAQNLLRGFYEETHTDRQPSLAYRHTGTVLMEAGA